MFTRLLIPIMIVILWLSQNCLAQSDCKASILSSRDTETINAPIKVSMKELETNPENFYGKTVTVVGKLHSTFRQGVFTIEDDRFLDKDILVVSKPPRSKLVVALDGKIEEGKNVRVTGFIVPYNRAKLECAYGPLRLESREGHSFIKNPVLIIDETF